MQFKIPQDVQRPDKIVGPLTLKQLIIVTIGGGISYVLYSILSKQYFLEVWLPPVLFILLFTAAIAFLKIHDIPFTKFVLLYIEYKMRPQQRTWQKMAGDVFISSLSATLKQTLGKRDRDKSELDRERFKKLDELTKLVDTHSEKMTAQKS